MNFLKVMLGGILLSICMNAFAQTDMNAVFQPNNKNILHINRAKDYTGSPLVFIEGISDKVPPEEENTIIKPLPPLEDSNIQNTITIRPLFGKEREVAFVPHTADWNFIIQILNDDEISVQEEVLFIKTNEIPSLVRDWPKSDLSLTEVRINGKEVPLKMVRKKDSLSLKLPELETGLHKLHLAYTIKGSGHFGQKSAQISLPLIGGEWALPTDALNGVILFPDKVKETTLSVLFGKNKIEIKEAFQIHQDPKGSLFFRSKNLIPASSSLQLDLSFQYDSFIRKSWGDKLMASSSFLIFLISFVIICSYFILNLIEIRMTSTEELAIRKKYTYKTNPFMAFLARTGEIWIGLILLWGCTFTVCFLTENFLSETEGQFLIILPIVFVFLMDYFVLRKRQQKLYLMQSELKKGEKK